MCVSGTAEPISKYISFDMPTVFFTKSVSIHISNIGIPISLDDSAIVDSYKQVVRTRGYRDITLTGD